MDFEIGKVYAVDITDLSVNECWFSDGKIAVFKKRSCGLMAFTLLKCIKKNEKDSSVLFEEYFTRKEIYCGELYDAKELELNVNNYEQVRHDVLGQYLLYINPNLIKKIDDKVLNALYFDLNNEVRIKNEIIGKILYSQNNLSAVMDEALEDMIQKSYPRAVAENIIYDYENEGKVKKIDKVNKKKGSK